MKGTLNVVQMLDWHDGLVLGLVAPSWRDGVFLCSLLATSGAKDARVFALLSLSDPEVMLIQSAAGGTWDALLRELERVVGAHDENVSVVRVDMGSEHVLDERMVPLVSVRDDLLGDIEQSFASERARWL
jgi:hypothetical protein